MNILRVGIAFPLAVISILQLEKRRFSYFYILVLLSISIQITVALLLLMLSLARPRTKISLKWKLYSVFIGASIMYFMAITFTGKG